MCRTVEVTAEQDFLIFLLAKYRPLRTTVLTLYSSNMLQENPQKGCHVLTLTECSASSLLFFLDNNICCAVGTNNCSRYSAAPSSRRPHSSNAPAFIYSLASTVESVKPPHISLARQQMEVREEEIHVGKITIK